MTYIKASNELYHYGMPRRSGRYPYGSGDRPYQNKKHPDNTNRKRLIKAWCESALGALAATAAIMAMGKIYIDSLNKRSALELTNSLNNSGPVIVRKSDGKIMTEDEVFK